MSAVLEIENVSFSYEPGKSIIKNMTLSFQRGEFHAILGLNGSGKSTLLKLLCGALKPDSGRVSAFGRIGLVFQNPEDQFVYSKVIDDVSFGPLNLGHSRDEARRISLSALARTNLQDKQDSLIETLSGGEMGRAALAGCLAMNPDLLILDEVLSMVSRGFKDEYLGYLLSLKDEGKTIILVTHDSSEAAYADYVHIVHEGEIISSGTSSSLLSDKALLDSIGIEMPLSSKVAHALIKRGFPLSRIPMAVEDLREALCELN